MTSLFKKGRKEERKLSPSIYISFLLISKFPFFSSFFLVVYKKGIVYFSLTLYFIIISQHRQNNYCQFICDAILTFFFINVMVLYVNNIVTLRESIVTLC